MSRWGLYVRDWLDALFEKHDDAYLAEKLARACELYLDSQRATCASDYAISIRRAWVAALREYRARNPRGDA